MTTLRNIPNPKGIALGRPLSHPIFNNFMHGGRLALCAESPNSHHTLRVWKGSLRLISIIIDRFEPRASLSGNAAVGVYVPGSTLRAGYVQGIPRVVW